MIEGELWQIAPQHVEETLQVLDEIEEYEPNNPYNLYERVRIMAYSDCQCQQSFDHQAYVYLMSATRLPAQARRVPARMHVAVWGQ